MSRKQDYDSEYIDRLLRDWEWKHEHYPKHFRPLPSYQSEWCQRCGKAGIVLVLEEYDNGKPAGTYSLCHEHWVEFKRHYEVL